MNQGCTHNQKEAHTHRDWTSKGSKNPLKNREQSTIEGPMRHIGLHTCGQSNARIPKRPNGQPTNHHRCNQKAGPALP